MCTAIAYKTNDLYFGRTLDYERSFGECVVVTPGRYRFDFRYAGADDRHYAIVGMAHVADGFPLYYDAANERGLCAAGLNFVGNAVYAKEPSGDGRTAVAVFEFIPWLLSSCTSVAQARRAIGAITLVGADFSEKYPCAQLHWLIADRDESIVVEPTADGLKIHDNPIGVLTNNPPFETQMFMLNNYAGLSAYGQENRFSDRLIPDFYSRGMGAIGLPGDLSSASRFVRAAFTKLNSVCDGSEEESVSQFFHILGSVGQTRGCVRLRDGCEITIYTSCISAAKGIYYYTTYKNSSINAVDMRRLPPDSDRLAVFPIDDSLHVTMLN